LHVDSACYCAALSFSQASSKYLAKPSIQWNTISAYG
jgi:hypothetical protein